MSNAPDSPFSQPFVCVDCGSELGFRSRRRNLVERYVLPLFLLKPVRCGECFRRDYRLIFTRVRERWADVPRIVQMKQPAPPNRNVA